MRRLIPAVRAAHIQVFIVPHKRWLEGAYKGWKHMNPSQIRANEDQDFAAGTLGVASSILNLVLAKVM